MRIAVVIPALDESHQIEATLASVGVCASPSAAQGATGARRSSGSIGRADPASGSPGRRPVLVDGNTVVALVADGGSRDDTCVRAERAGAVVVRTERGRAIQLQAALDAPEAREADVVLMLHADTCLGAGWSAAISGALADGGTVGGAFRFEFAPVERATASERRALRVVEWGARWRVRWLGLPYGDQGLFARREVLDAIGGVPQVGLMEDVDLVRALRRRGRLAALDVPARTSARRHLENGVMRTAFVHIGAALAAAAGVSRGRIAGWLGR